MTITQHKKYAAIEIGLYTLLWLSVTIHSGPILAQSGSITRAFPPDFFFSYQLVTSKPPSGKFRAKWVVTNHWNKPLKVGVIKARYQCIGESNLVEVKHYVTAVINPGQSGSEPGNPVCEDGHPNVVDIDVEYYDPGDYKAREIPCPNDKPVSERRFVLDSVLMDKGIAQLTFNNGTRITLNAKDGLTDGSMQDVAKGICGGDQWEEGFLGKIKNVVRDAAKKNQEILDAQCKKGDAEACKDAEGIKGLMRQAGPPRV